MAGGTPVDRHLWCQSVELESKMRRNNELESPSYAFEALDIVIDIGMSNMSLDRMPFAEVCRVYLAQKRASSLEQKRFTHAGAGEGAASTISARA